MSSMDSAFRHELQQAELDVARADAAFRGDLQRLKAHATRPASYSAPLGIFGALVAYRLFRRALRTRPRPSAMAAAAAPAKAGVAALLLRLGLPAVVGFARDQAQGWARGNPDRSGYAGPGASPASSSQPLPRVAATLDRARFAGRWFEAGRLVPAGNAAPAGRDGMDGPASLVLVPVPDGFKVERSTTVADARRGTRQRTRSGVLRPTDPAGHPSELSLTWAPSWSQWMPWVWSDFWVLEVDTSYTFALIGDRARTTLLVLSRTPSIEESAWRQVVETAAAEGYPIGRFERHGVDTQPGH